MAKGKVAADTVAEMLGFGMPVGPGAGPGIAAAGGAITPEKLGWLTKGLTKGRNYLGTPEGKMLGGSVATMWLLEKLMQSGHEMGMRGIQREGLERQSALATPENLFYQAALPQAQQEEQMARTALLTQLSGGVIGPSLARGERRI